MKQELVLPRAATTGFMKSQEILEVVGRAKNQGFQKVSLLYSQQYIEDFLTIVGVFVGNVCFTSSLPPRPK
ncbi:MULTISPECIES: hypothetical protein [Azotobacter]|nr:hypothetical protein [Azotobacter vinelandii]